MDKYRPHNIPQPPLKPNARGIIVAMMVVVAIVFLFLVMTRWASAAGQCAVPGAINPVVTQTNIRATICKPGWTKTVRPPVEYTNGLKRKLLSNNYSVANMKMAELDHCIPLELGGDPRNSQNLWLQPWNGPCGAHSKDKIENSLREQVCAGKITLAAARVRVMQWCPTGGQSHARH